MKRIRSMVLLASLPITLALPAMAAPFAYVANQNSQGLVAVIDLATDTQVTTISTVGSGDPYWVAISRNGQTVAVSLHNSAGMALIGAATNTLLGVVGGVGSEPEAVALNSSGTTAYVADESGDDLYVVAVPTRSVTAGPIDLSGSCSEPENMVISPDDAFLYITCATSGGTVIRVATAGFGITTIATGLNDPHGIVLNSAGTRLYYTNGTDAFEYNTTSLALTGVTFAGCSLYGGALSPDESKLYCVEEGSDLLIYATASGGLLATVPLGASAARAVGATTGRVYVPVSGSSAVEVIDATTMANLAGNIPITGGIGASRPRGIAIGPGGTVGPTAIPTLSEWGMLLLLALLIASGWWTIRR